MNLIDPTWSPLSKEAHRDDRGRGAACDSGVPRGNHPRPDSIPLPATLRVSCFVASFNPLHDEAKLISERGIDRRVERVVWTSACGDDEWRCSETIVNLPFLLFFFAFFWFCNLRRANSGVQFWGRLGGGMLRWQIHSMLSLFICYRIYMLAWFFIDANFACGGLKIEYFKKF